MRGSVASASIASNHLSLSRNPPSKRHMIHTNNSTISLGCISQRASKSQLRGHVTHLLVGVFLWAGNKRAVRRSQETGWVHRRSVAFRRAGKLAPKVWLARLNAASGGVILSEAVAFPTSTPQGWFTESVTRTHKHHRTDRSTITSVAKTRPL